MHKFDVFLRRFDTGIYGTPNEEQYLSQKLDNYKTGARPVIADSLTVDVQMAIILRHIVHVVIQKYLIIA